MKRENEQKKKTNKQTNTNTNTNKQKLWNRCKQDEQMVKSLKTQQYYLIIHVILKSNTIKFKLFSNCYLILCHMFNLIFLILISSGPFIILSIKAEMTTPLTHVKPPYYHYCLMFSCVSTIYKLVLLMREFQVQVSHSLIIIYKVLLNAN